MRIANGEIANGEIVKAMRDARGNVAEAARALGLGRRTLFRWLTEDPELEKALKRIRKEST
jgi:transcriptional regulator of acetoin/glycerol metabolism